MKYSSTVSWMPYLPRKVVGPFFFSTFGAREFISESYGKLTLQDSYLIRFDKQVKTKVI